jgi:hypothetical protein
MMRRLLLLAALLAAVSLTAVPVHAYSHFGTGVGTVRVHWKNAAPVRWLATDRGVPGVSSSAFQAAAERAFKTWQDVPTASISFTFGGFTSAEPAEDDDLSVLGFQDHPEMNRVLAATSFLYDDNTGELTEADIFFNSAFDWLRPRVGGRPRDRPLPRPWSFRARGDGIPA